MGPICSSAQREKRSRPPAAAFGQRRQLAQSNCCGQRKRQTAQLGSHARESERSLSLASLADRAWLCAADLLEHTLLRLTAAVDREGAMFWPRARRRCHAIVIAGATPWIDVACCVAREVQARLWYHHEHLFEFGLSAPLPHGHECAMQGRKDASHSDASRPESVSAELLTRVTDRDGATWCALLQPWVMQSTNYLLIFTC